ncbi:hypothetical protein F2P81_003356 [Scophthalmus maximus]|uniref:Brf1 TBP-binding domain-containing protein n=1 Tax=Scophthalmus maximus TaxID=52904 RepID=A0A6A4TI92_SCOMX|nr:hypothetical protein F2P81_003356 [Scophthalmus maximus]
MHEFRRTVKEIVSVVKVCETTLRKRLTEFEDTPTSQLTIEEFMKVDLDQECDPPCFTAGLRKRKVQQLEIELKKKMDDVEGKTEIQHDEESEVPSTPTRKESDGGSQDEDELQAVAKHFGKDMCELTMEALLKLERRGLEEEEEEPEEQEEGGGIPKRKGPSLESILGPMPTASTLGLSESIGTCIGDGKENDGAADSGELDLSGIDDGEIELYLLDDREVKIKTALWMAENSDYLKEQREKAAKIAKEKELGIYKEKKPRGPSKKRDPIRASTADEAIGKMLEQKKISSKINYDVLKDLNIKPCPSPARSAESPIKKEPSAAAKLTGRSRHPARAPLSLSTPLSTLGKSRSERGEKPRGRLASNDTPMISHSPPRRLDQRPLQPFIAGQPNKKMAVEQPFIAPPPRPLGPSPSCAVGSSERWSSGSSGSVNQEENIATRGRVNKACYLATPRPPLPPHGN